MILRDCHSFSNWGTEDQADFAYSNGNSDPGRGFGHIAIVVDDIEKACERFESLNVKFIKKLTDGSMKNIAFIADPDNYWVEVRNHHGISIHKDLNHYSHFRLSTTLNTVLLSKFSYSINKSQGKHDISIAIANTCVYMQDYR